MCREIDTFFKTNVNFAPKNLMHINSKQTILFCSNAFVLKSIELVLFKVFTHVIER
jgi:hypothetical protein